MCLGHYVLLRQLSDELDDRLFYAETALQKVRGTQEGLKEVLFDADIRTSATQVLHAPEGPSSG